MIDEKCREVIAIKLFLSQDRRKRDNSPQNHGIDDNFFTPLFKTGSVLREDLESRMKEKQYIMRKIIGLR